MVSSPCVQIYPDHVLRLGYFIRGGWFIMIVLPHQRVLQCCVHDYCHVCLRMDDANTSLSCGSLAASRLLSIAEGSRLSLLIIENFVHVARRSATISVNSGKDRERAGISGPACSSSRTSCTCTSLDKRDSGDGVSGQWSIRERCYTTRRVKKIVV